MTTQACKRRRSVYISSGSEDSGTDSEVERSKPSKKPMVTSISLCEHQPSSNNKVKSMNTSKTRVCRTILGKLMDHPGGWLFHQPVDPVLFGIPDYFDVIRNPMDLGTVKKKLTNKSYFGTDEFAADVRLTFSNAMKYNPPGNQVHTVAEQLNIMFDSEWKLYEKKWRDRNLASEQLHMKVIKARTAVNSKPVVSGGLVSCSNSVAKKTLTDAISSKLKIKFSVRGSGQTLSKGANDTSLQAAASRMGSLNHSIPSTKDSAKVAKVQSSEHSSQSIGNESRSCSDTSTSPLPSYGQGDGSYIHDEPLSPTKALRAAILKRRFAGTIVKAQQKALLDHQIDPAKLQMEKERLEKRQQQEKERIEAQVKAAEVAAQFKLDEETRIKREQEREAARLALQMMKKTIDIDNSDFLKELENMTKKWELNPPGKLIVDFVDGIDLPPDLGSPLERLGLFMKKDLEEEVEHEMDDSIAPSMVVDVEEGEIGCCG
ncbi:transcription factor GTE12 isoform X1 [Lolium perenne]|uniref:transcription factor GTE12 isoform X1 n=1 Tax=Lolium perenne TaxID=4522 RepID=UPI0021F563ED|nr:transcription factor GTE9-like isoform X1 [Lolium perenne]XP_051177535.1 transcription factor GTE9-like isoform X1 [Lolium perenne]XP_051177542.1 transcription factor GTE9-like isoform X1 [Lolium perenne]